jgi:DNA-binding LytR/AlgR family response regulator
MVGNESAVTTENTSTISLTVLAVDDEAPSLADLVYELRAQPQVGRVVEAMGATEALRLLRSEDFDVVFLDVRMPGLDGLELARVLQRFRHAPAVVFVTAYDSHAVDAFEISAVDYLLKPVRPERVAEALRRVVAAIGAAPTTTTAPRANGADHQDVASPGAAPKADAHAADAHAEASDISAPADVSARDPLDGELIPIESAGRMRIIDRRDIQYVSSSGDYVRLHTQSTNVLLRTSLAVLEEKWKAAGFVRIHRSFLVSISHIDEVRIEPRRGFTVVIGSRHLPVSRRMGRTLRTQLTGEAAQLSSRRPGGSS